MPVGDALPRSSYLLVIIRDGLVSRAVFSVALIGELSTKCQLVSN